MTEAAGPESAVRIGRLRISLISITPPSPLMIIRGTVTPAARTDDSVALAVIIIFGRMEALIAAVRVRRVRPYSFVISEAMVTGTFFFSAQLWIIISSSILSTPKAMEATITCEPWFSNSSIFWLITSSVSIFFLMKVLYTLIILPTFSSRTISLRASWRFARNPSRPPPATPTTPTLATSPSIKALVAWVVEWATNTTSSGAMLFSRIQF